jgi:hypothetical protein
MGDTSPKNWNTFFWTWMRQFHTFQKSFDYFRFQSSHNVQYCDDFSTCWYFHWE